MCRRNTIPVTRVGPDGAGGNLAYVFAASPPVGWKEYWLAVSPKPSFNILAVIIS